MSTLKVYKHHPDAIIPTYATENSSCFDIHACIKEDSPIIVYNDIWGPKDQTPGMFRPVVVIPGRSRVLIKTGLIFDIPSGYSLRLHPRSGIALKHGVTLMNAEGVVDEDYVEPVGIILFNSSCKSFELSHGDRICQAELVADTRIKLETISEKPLRKTSRAGGFGSTGT